MDPEIKRWMDKNYPVGGTPAPAPQEQFKTAAPPVAPGKPSDAQPLISGDNNVNVVTGSNGTGVIAEADAWDHVKVGGRDMGSLDIGNLDFRN